MQVTHVYHAAVVIFNVTNMFLKLYIWENKIILIISEFTV